MAEQNVSHIRDNSTNSTCIPGSHSHANNHNGTINDGPTIYPVLAEGHCLSSSSKVGFEEPENEKNDVRESLSLAPRRDRRISNRYDQPHHGMARQTPNGIGEGAGAGAGKNIIGGSSRSGEVEQERKIEQSRYPTSASGSSVNYPHHLASNGHPVPHPKLGKAGLYLAISTIQSYMILTTVRSVADPAWIIPKGSNPESGGQENPAHWGMIGKKEICLLGCAILFALLSCVGVTLRIMDKTTRLRRTPVISAYLQAILCTAAMSSFLGSYHLKPESQFSHGFLACVIAVVLSFIVVAMLTFDWWRGFPSAGLSANLKALIISSFMITIVTVVGAGFYTWLEHWTFDESVHFCIVSFSTIGYGNISPNSVAGRIFFFFYSFLGISTFGFFVVSLRNSVIEQFQWRLLERFSSHSHLNRVQTRMSDKDLSYPMARFEEEQMVKVMVKRKMIVYMILLWLVVWFGGAGVFCALEKWTFLESLYFCYVTLTTMGFGDYLPNEPGSIEFWNIYVFVGLTFFAYVLSLISESMESHIHLVDDINVDEDDEFEDMLDWEKCEDINIPLVMSPSTCSGQLGMEGLRWPQQNHRQTLSHSNEQQVPDITEITTSGRESGIQDNQDNRPQVSSQDVHSEDETSARGGGGVSGGDISPRVSLAVTPQSQTDQLKNRPRRRGSVGRVLKVPAKERKQMLQAEYYATHGSPPICCDTHVTNGNETESNGEGSSHHESHDDAGIVMNSPVTIKFVDMYGVPHQRKIRRAMTMGPTVEQPRSMIEGMESTTGSNVSQMDGHDNSTPSQIQGYVYGTSGYHDILAQRRYGVLLKNQEPLPQQSSSNFRDDGEHCPEARVSQGRRNGDEDHSDIVSIATIHDQGHRPQGRVAQDHYLKTSALQHQPQVKFESPVVNPLNAFRSDLAPSSSRYPLSEQPQQRISSSLQGALLPQESIQDQGECAPRGILGTSLSTDVNSDKSITDRNTSETYEKIHDPAIANSRSFGLERTQQSQFSDAAKVDDPSVLLQKDPLDSPGANVNGMYYPQKRNGIAPNVVTPDI